MSGTLLYETRPSPVAVTDETTEVRFYRRTIEFEYGEPLLITGPANTGKLLQPLRAHAQWHHGEQIRQIMVEGTVMTKGGSPGTVPGRINFGAEGTEHTAKAPDWILNAFDIAQES